MVREPLGRDGGDQLVENSLAALAKVETTHLNIGHTRSNVRGAFYMLSQEYGPAWIAFREFWGENDILLRLVAKKLRQVSFERGYTLIDVGCGDATLTSELIADGVLNPQPQIVHLLEPLSSLGKVAQETSHGYISDQDIRCFVRRESLGEFRRLPLYVCIPGFITVVHASYYFVQRDVDMLMRLSKEDGFAFLMIENNERCWVSEVMREIGNVNHPQFDTGRYANLLTCLDVSESERSLEEYEIPFTMPSRVQLEAMTPFFYCCDNRQRDSSAQADKLREVLERRQDRGGLRFIYNVVLRAGHSEN